ncbi:hypothetical protein N2152v2_000961 [Parachlorella kessleri]
MAGQKRGRAEAEAERPRFSKVDQETSKYYEEISNHFKTLEDGEERQLVADNALGEAAGSEPRVASDAACSRVLETLLPHASIPALSAFVGALCEGENLGATCTSGPFGSHVFEKALKVLGERAATADEDGYSTIEQTLSKVTDAVSDNLYDMAVHKYATHVARRLLSVLAGRDVAPAPGRKQQQQAQQHAEGEAGEEEQKQAKQHAKRAGAPGGLAAKLGSAAGKAGAAGTADYPHLLEKVVTTVLSDDWAETLGEVQRDQFGSPLLQAVLRAAACLGNEDLHQRLLLRCLGAPTLDALSVDSLHALMKDRAGSHVMEASGLRVVFETAPDEVYQKLSSACFKGHLLDLARHPAANFAVQAGIAALRKPAQLKRVFEDLRPHLASLLRSRRGGVVAALAGAAGRLGVLEPDVAAALWHALHASGQGAAGQGAGERSGSPLEALLTLDTTVKLGDGGRLSPLGCALAATLLRYPPAACKQFAETLAALAPGQLAAAAKDSAGCRVLEAYIEGAGASPKKRRALLQALEGSYAAVAAQPAGSYFVEKCYALADLKEKEAITRELAAAEQRLAATYRGLTLLRRCNVEAFKKDAGNWQQRVAAADAVRREFEDLFADGAAAPSGAAAEDAEAAGADDGAEGGGDELLRGGAAVQGEDGQEGQPRKKKKKERKEQGSSSVPDPAVEMQPKQKQEKEKRKRRGEPAAEPGSQEQTKQRQKKRSRDRSAQDAEGDAANGSAHKEKKRKKQKAA